MKVDESYWLQSRAVTNQIREHGATEMLNIRQCFLDANDKMLI